MNLDTLLDRLEATKCPVALGAFADPVPGMPYILYSFSGCTPFYADGEVYYCFSKISITVCAKKKDLLLETRMRIALRGNAYRRTETKNESENRYEYTYDLEVTENV